MSRTLLLGATLALAACAHPAAKTPGVKLEDLSWLEAESVLTPEAVVVIPIGAASKEHGPHLKLSNDARLAAYLTNRVAERARVVIAPNVPYHYYPAFLEYPGSTSLRLETARDLMVDLCRSLSRAGPRRFYALNTGVSTNRALEPAAVELAREGILLRYTHLIERLGPLTKGIEQQAGGTHADEIETSMLLAIDPAAVEMKKAVKEYDPVATKGPLRRRRGEAGSYSPSGVWGDPTLATREKGEKVLAGLVEALVLEIEALRAAALTPPAP